MPGRVWVRGQTDTMQRLVDIEVVSRSVLCSASLHSTHLCEATQKSIGTLGCYSAGHGPRFVHADQLAAVVRVSVPFRFWYAPHFTERCVCRLLLLWLEMCGRTGGAYHKRGS